MNPAYSKRERFKNWRSRRPFWGATLSSLSGLIILYVPAQLYELAATPGSMIVAGFFLGGLTLLMGVLGFFMPKLSTLLGILAIFASVLSILGALGGFFIGTLLGIIGGAILIAWKPELAPNDSIQKPSQDDLAEKEIASGKESIPD